MKTSDLAVKDEPQTLGNLFTAQNDTISRLRQEALGKVDFNKKKPEPETKKMVSEKKEKLNIPQSEDIESLMSINYVGWLEKKKIFL